MAQSLKQLKSRIKSVEGVKKLTRAMEMISVAKLRSLEKALFASREYIRSLEKITAHLLASFPEVGDGLLESRPEKKNIRLCVVTSDAGLCASYNSNIIRMSEEFIAKNTHCKVDLSVIGKKGLNYFRKKGFTIADSKVELYGHYSNELADSLSAKLIEAYLRFEIDEAYIAYTKFISAARVVPAIEKVLNVETPPADKIEYLTEPGPSLLIKELLPLYVRSKVRNIILNAFTAENSTRVMAMNEATTNAGTLLDGLVIQRNKMRQADITVELIEVISSASALKG